MTVPESLAPTWSQLPGMAWLVTTRLSGQVGKIPGLRHLAHAAAFPAMFLSLAGAHAEHRLAVYQRRAVVAIRPLEPRRSTADRWRRLAVQLGGFLVAAVAYAVMLLALIVLAALAGLPAEAGMDTAFVVVVAFAMLGVSAISRPSRMVSGIRAIRGATASARDTGTPLVEAVMLAAVPDDRRAATSLARTLLDHGAQYQLSVLARPSSAEVARAYANLGFRPVDDHPTVLLLQSHTRRRRKQPQLAELGADTTRR